MKPNNWIITLLVLVILGIGTRTLLKYTKPMPGNSDQPSHTNKTDQTNQSKSKLADPIDNAGARVTKKPFGIYVTPQNSPVQPEKFIGYHTGVDFETFSQEQNAEVPFYAICDGKILQKRTATGYGGVFVQACSIDNQPVTVIYGHVSLKSIGKNIGDNLTAGEKIGSLGQPPAETDSERKHLHLGIHKGSQIDIKGYVQSQGELSAWLDYRAFAQ